MQEIAVEGRTNTYVTFSHGSMYMDVPVLADLQKLLYISSGRTQDAFKKICKVRWIIGIDGKRVRGLPAVCQYVCVCVSMFLWVPAYVLTWSCGRRLSRNICTQERCLDVSITTTVLPLVRWSNSPFCF